MQQLAGMSTNVFILNSHDLFVHTNACKIMALMLLVTFKLFYNQKKCHTRKTKGLKGTCKTHMWQSMRLHEKTKLLFLCTGFPLFSSDKIPRLLQYFFIFPRLLLNIFSCPLFNICFFMYGLHLLLGNYIKGLDALKYSFYNTQK